MSSLQLVPASQVSVATNATHSVSVPCGVGPGDTFQTEINGQLVSLRCPANASGGSTIQVAVQLPPMAEAVPVPVQGVPVAPVQATPAVVQQAWAPAAHHQVAPLEVSASPIEPVVTPRAKRLAARVQTWANVLMCVTVPFPMILFFPGGTMGLIAAAGVVCCTPTTSGKVRKARWAYNLAVASAVLSAAAVCVCAGLCGLTFHYNAICRESMPWEESCGDYPDHPRRRATEELLLPSGGDGGGLGPGESGPAR